jgi:ubiquinone/menaquinone biosynthesis C-methylase UbiE
MDMWHAIGAQLRHPSGIGGRMIGHAMRWANDRPTRMAIDALDPAPGDHVLDVGCGSGHAVALLAERVGRSGYVTGVDGSATMIAQASKTNARAIAAGQVRLMVADFDHLPFDPASFDGIVASNVIYFWNDPARIVARLRDLLKPGGRLVIYATATETMRRWKFAQPDTHHWIDEASLRSALAEGGFPEDQAYVSEAILPFVVHGLVAVATK